MRHWRDIYVGFRIRRDFRHRQIVGGLSDVVSTDHHRWKAPARKPADCSV
jgi:hypothetical protein